MTSNNEEPQTLWSRFTAWISTLISPTKPTASDGFKYYAFISYKREDEKWAKWLHRKIEHYNIPAVVRQEHTELPKHLHPLPKRLRPVFRDKDDFNKPTLQGGLRDEVQQSRYLIVICSPNSAKSKWVGQEINDFADLGRTENIIPFIVEGTPDNPDPEKRCFHPAFYEKTPDILGITVDEDGKEKAFVKVMDRLLGMNNFDLLWGRHRRAQRKKNTIYSIFAFLFLAVLGYAIDYNRLKTEYYADYVEGPGGLPQGVIELSKEKVAKRNSHYCFESRQRKLRRVVHANSAGFPVEHEDTEHTTRPAQMHFAYAEDGYLLSTEMKNSKGKSIVTYFWKGEEHDSIAFEYGKKGGDVATLAAAFTNIEENQFTGELKILPFKSEVSSFKLIRDKNGRVVKRLFRLNVGKTPLARDADGICGFEYDLDMLGRVVEMRYLGLDEKPRATRTGVMGRRYQYDEYGNIKMTTYFGENGKPATNTGGFAIGTSLANHDGNIVEECYYGADEKLLLWKAIFEYDARGNRTSGASYSHDGKPLSNQLGVFKQVGIFDKNGNVIETYALGVNGEFLLDLDSTEAAAAAFMLGTNGKLNPVRNGVAKYLARYDENNRQIEVSYLNAEGKPCIGGYGVAKGTYSYDDRGNVLAVTYFGLDGKPCLHPWGYAKITMIYDDLKDNLLEMNYLGIDGRSCTNKMGISKAKAQYDADSNRRISEAYFDEQGRPCWDSSCRVAEFRVQYDTSGNPKALEAFGPDGKPTLCHVGAAKIELEYDEFGNLEETRFFGTDGKLCINRQTGVAKVKRKFRDGWPSEESYFDKDGKPIACKNGMAKIVQKNDKFGNGIEFECFDADGNPCLGDMGAFRLKRVFDKIGNLVQEEYFGIDGLPCYDKSGTAGMKLKYDIHRREIERAYFGTDGLPYVNFEGVSIFRRKYDSKGQLIETTSFGVDGKPKAGIYGFAKFTIKYDDRGNKIETAYFDSDGKSVLSNEKVASIKTKYDAWGNPVEARCYGIDGKPCNGASGFALAISQYDTFGRVIRQSFFDDKGKPCKDMEGAASIAWKYNEFDRPVEQSYFDETGKPARGFTGYAKMLTTYDAHGYAIKHEIYDEKNAPCANINGVWKVEHKYDDFGLEIEMENFGTSGRPVRSAEGFFRVRSKYDDRGNKIEIAYFGVNGKPCLNNKGVWKIEWQINLNGLPVTERYFDVDGRLCENKSGCAMVKNKYNAQRKLIECTLYRKDESVEYIGHFEYDRFGNKVGMRTYDANGKELSNQRF